MRELLGCMHSPLSEYPAHERNISCAYHELLGRPNPATERRKILAAAKVLSSPKVDHCRMWDRMHVGRYACIWDDFMFLYETIIHYTSIRVCADPRGRLGALPSPGLQAGSYRYTRGVTGIQSFIGCQ